MADDLTQVSFKTAIHSVEVYGLILVDLQGLVMSWNTGAQHLLGFTENEAVGQHFKFMFTLQDISKGVPQKEMSTALEEGHAYDDRWHVRKDKSEIYVNGGLCLLRSESDKPLGFVKIIRDQTEKKLQLEKIAELNEKLIRLHGNLKSKSL